MRPGTNHSCATQVELETGRGRTLRAGVRQELPHQKILRREIRAEVHRWGPLWTVYQTEGVAIRSPDQRYYMAIRSPLDQTEGVAILSPDQTDGMAIRWLDQTTGCHVVALHTLPVASNQSYDGVSRCRCARRRRCIPRRETRLILRRCGHLANMFTDFDFEISLIWPETRGPSGWTTG